MLNAVHFERKRKRALLPKGVEAMVGAIRTDEPSIAGIRDPAIVTLARATGAKPGNLAILNRNHVRFAGSFMEVYVRRGGRAASWLQVFPLEDASQCPVIAMKAYVDALPAGDESAPLFRSLNRWGGLRAGKLKRQSLAVVIKNAAERAGIDPSEIGGQSIRLGNIAESVAEHGVSYRHIAETVGYSETRHLGAFVNSADSKRRQLMAQETM